MYNKIAVLGLGSAGIQSICHMLSWLDGNWEVYSIHDPKIEPLGIGESTNPSFVTALQYGLNFDLYNDLKELDGTLKVGTVYKDWRNASFINPLINGNVAIHFNTHSLKKFALPRLKKRWGNKFRIIEGNIISVIESKDCGTVVVNEKKFEFDFIIDCRGFPRDFSEYNLCHDFVNSALVYNSNNLENWNYTGHKATANGWMFEVPLTTRTSYGYLYNKNITDKTDALLDLSDILNKSISTEDITEYNFLSYYSKQIFTGRIIRNGNRAVFFEPMFANSLWLYNNINCYLVDYINQNLTANEVNICFSIDATKVRDMIAFNYHGGSLYNSKFWNQTTEVSSNMLKDCRYLKDTINAFKLHNSNKDYWVNSYQPQWVFPPINLLTLDRNFEYNYFS